MYILTGSLIVVVQSGGRLPLIPASCLHFNEGTTTRKLWEKKNLNPYLAVQNSGSHTLIDAFLCKEPGVGAVATLGGLLDKLKEIRGLHKGM